MDTVTFTLWDAPDFGSPSIEPVSTHWAGNQLVSVTLNRSQADRGDDVPDLAICTMNPAVPNATHQGLALKPLLEFAPRLSAAQTLSAREAGEALFRLSRDPGTPTSLTVGENVIDALRYDVPVTGDWVIVAVNQDYRVCVAGDHRFTLPKLLAADVPLWEPPLLDQIAEVMSESEGQ